MAVAQRILREAHEEAPVPAHEPRVHGEHEFGEQRFRGGCTCGWTALVSFRTRDYAAGSAQWHMGQVAA